MSDGDGVRAVSEGCRECVCAAQCAAAHQSPLGERLMKTLVINAHASHNYVT